MKIVEEFQFNPKNIDVKNFEIAQYELCEFHNIDFSNCSFSEAKFIECTFVDCDLSLINLTYTTLQTVNFENCKMLGLQFESCSDFLFQINLKNCKVDNSNFYGKDLKRCYFLKSSLIGVDFSNTDLSKVAFKNCNLLNANFENCKLIKTDFSAAKNFSINLNKNTISKPKFSKSNLEGLLTEYDLELLD